MVQLNTTTWENLAKTPGAIIKINKFIEINRKWMSMGHRSTHMRATKTKQYNNAKRKKESKKSYKLL